MASNTTNYGLRKPSATDIINVDADLNNNYDIIDTQLKSNQDVAAAAQQVARNTGYINTQATDIALPADVVTTFIAQLQNVAVLPVGPVVFEVWFSVSAPVAPANLIFYANSGLARDWLLHAWSQGGGSSGGNQGFTGKTLVLPVNPGTSPTLYQVRGYASSINPSSHVRLELNPQTNPATLHNFVCLSTVNALEEL